MGSFNEQVWGVSDERHQRSTVVGAEHDRSLEEMIFETTSAALADAGLSLAELDGVVLPCVTAWV